MGFYFLRSQIIPQIHI